MVMISYKGAAYKEAIEYEGFGKVGPSGSDSDRKKYFLDKSKSCATLAKKYQKSNPVAAKLYDTAAYGFKELANYGYFGKDDEAVADYHGKSSKALAKANRLIGKK